MKRTLTTDLERTTKKMTLATYIAEFCNTIVT